MLKLSGATGSLSAVFRRYIADLDAKGAFWEWKKYRVTLGKLEAVFGPEVPFAALGAAGLTRFAGAS